MLTRFFAEQPHGPCQGESAHGLGKRQASDREAEQHLLVLTLHGQGVFAEIGPDGRGHLARPEQAELAHVNHRGLGGALKLMHKD